MTLDKKDLKILNLLSLNCRMSLTQIAKKTQVSREVADYRIKRLVKEGIIKSFGAEINLEALGFTRHVVYLELKNVDKQKEEKIFEKLKTNNFISWLVTSTGKWSIIFDLHSKNMKHLGELIKNLKKDLKGFLGNYNIVTLEDYEYFHSKFFGFFFSSEKKNPKNLEFVKLNEIDLSILQVLRNNARIDYVKLSSLIKLTPEAISKRIKRLKENNIIKQFYIFPDLTKLGFEYYNIQINLDNANEQIEKKILSFLKNHKSVSFIYKPISHWDIEFGVFVSHPGELRNFMQNLRSHFPENIRIKDVSLFYEEISGNFLPEGVFNAEAFKNLPQQIFK